MPCLLVVYSLSRPCLSPAPPLSRRLGWGYFTVRADVQIRPEWGGQALQLAWLLDFDGGWGKEEREIWGARDGAGPALLSPHQPTDCCGPAMVLLPSGPLPPVLPGGGSMREVKLELEQVTAGSVLATRSTAAAPAAVGPVTPTAAIAGGVAVAGRGALGGAGGSEAGAGAGAGSAAAVGGGAEAGEDNLEEYEEEEEEEEGELGEEEEERAGRGAAAEGNEEYG